MINAINVHGLNLDDAIKVIKRNIEIAYNSNQSYIYVNHGYSHGDKIKSWCLKHAIKHPYVLKTDSTSNNGVSIIYIKLNIKKM
ncbi:MAG: Smr/MutS family protein [Erysipelotrichaceae bacterium]|nr:Smr/MutS family protein [Erysipelotrichaceae bacterium]